MCLLLFELFQFLGCDISQLAKESYREHFRHLYVQYHKDGLLGHCISETLLAACVSSVLRAGPSGPSPELSGDSGQPRLGIDLPKAASLQLHFSRSVNTALELKNKRPTSTFSMKNNVHFLYALINSRTSERFLHSSLLRFSHPYWLHVTPTANHSVRAATSQCSTERGRSICFPGSPLPYLGFAPFFLQKNGIAVLAYCLTQRWPLVLLACCNGLDFSSTSNIKQTQTILQSRIQTALRLLAAQAAWGCNVAKALTQVPLQVPKWCRHGTMDWK